MENQLSQFGQESSVNQIEFKRIYFKALKYWYLVALSLLTGLTAAFLVNRYTTKIFPVNATIMIRESEGRAERLLYNNPLANPYRNFFNEPYFIKSYPIVQAAVEELNFQVQIEKEGNIKIIEQYNSLPFSIHLADSQEAVATSFYVEFTDGQSFKCIENSEQQVNKVYSLLDTVNCGGNRWYVQATGDMSSVKGERFLVNVFKPVDVATRYINRLNVNWAEPGSSVVRLDINGPIPKKEIDFLAALIRQYTAADLEKKRLAATRSILFIDDQLKDIRDSLSYFESLLERFKKQNVVTDLSAEADRIFQQVDLVQKERTKLQVSENYYKYLEDYLRTEHSNDFVILPTSLGISDQLLNDLVNQLVILQTDLRSNRPSDRINPLVEAQKRKIDETRANILESVKNLRGTDNILKKSLDQQLSKMEKQLSMLPEAERKLISLQRNYSLSENIYLFLMQKRAEAGISQAATTSDITVINPPRQSGGFITPKVKQNYLIFGGLAFVLPFIVLVLGELFNNKIQSKEDIERATRVPFIGGIGHKSSETNLVVYEKPKSAIAESFRALRSNLNYFTHHKDRKIFMITSSLSGEGKTFTTINLATVFAMSGKKTLIIGADLRKPKIHNDFELSNDRGLSTYLSGLHEKSEIIQSTTIPMLDIISGGPVPPNPSELILSPKTDLLVAELSKEYEYILIDTPPIALITDGFELMKYADHTIYLVRQNYTPKNLLRGVEEYYSTGKMKSLSLVLNDIRISGPGYGYGYQGYGYYYVNYNYGNGYNYYEN